MLNAVGHKTKINKTKQKDRKWDGDLVGGRALQGGKIREDRDECD